MWSQLCLTSRLPSSSLRRWFSIQNSQLVYQKKLKVFWGTGSLLGRPHLDYGPGCLVEIGTGLRIQTGTESKRSEGQGV